LLLFALAHVEVRAEGSGWLAARRTSREACGCVVVRLLTGASWVVNGGVENGARVECECSKLM
jgi:hypothetical protein